MKTKRRVHHPALSPFSRRASRLLMRSLLGGCAWRVERRTGVLDRHRQADRGVVVPVASIREQSDDLALGVEHGPAAVAGAGAVDGHLEGIAGGADHGHVAFLLEPA